jgi:hypothetical protein
MDHDIPIQLDENKNTMPPNVCPTCGKRTDQAHDGWPLTAPRKPEPKDFVLCHHCCEVLAFDKDMKLHKVTEADCKNLPPQLAIEIFMQQVICAAHLEYRKATKHLKEN